MALKGQMVGRARVEKPARSPERELLAAVILQALADALAGDAEAATWMDFYAPDIAYLWLGIEPCLIASWRKLDPNLPWTSPAFRSALNFSTLFAGKYAPGHKPALDHKPAPESRPASDKTSKRK